MKIINMHVDKEWFELIKNGSKTVEGRKNEGRWSLLKKGHLLKIYNDDEYIIKEIKNIRVHNSLKEYIINEGLENTLPGVKSLKEGIDVYLRYYTKEDIFRYGIIAIEF